jgi:four helix bundle protein
MSNVEYPISKLIIGYWTLDICSKAGGGLLPLVRLAQSGTAGAHVRLSHLAAASTECAAYARTRYDLEDRLIDFAAQICLLTDRFPTTAIARHVGAQLMRSATSPFANYGEAQGAESRQDFLHKLRVCLKELRETQAWLKFVHRMGFCAEQIQPARQECDELVAIFVASIKTAASKM